MIESCQEQRLAVKTHVGEGRGQPGRGEGGAPAVCGREFWGPGGLSVVDNERSGKQRTGALRLWPGRLLDAP